MHLAYLDESFHEGVAIVGAVIMPHGGFGWAERLHSIAVEQLFESVEIDDKFEEFHARDLFKGENAFKDIPENKRFSSLTVLLSTLKNYKFPFIYSAIDLKKLAKAPAAQGLFGIADPLVAALKLCSLGVEKWAQDQQLFKREGHVTVDYQHQYLFISDDTKDQALKKHLRQAYRQIRGSHPYTTASPIRLYHAHDEMYFGTSHDSVGIQLVDACTYFMQRHLTKRNPEAKDTADEFYWHIASQAICAKPEPEWSNFRDLLLEHRNAVKPDWRALDQKGES